jgi:oxygen-independent coproporphyrinogen-3 oxidase
MMQDSLTQLRQNAAKAAPRYTSYPTAPHFGAAVDRDVYGEWLRKLPANATLSLYIHIPFCRDLCWFCACRTQGARRTGPVERYLEFLVAEIDAVARLVPDDARVVHMHWGGGSPTALSAGQIVALNTFLRNRFTFAHDAEVAVEVFPGELDDEKIGALGRIGLTRASVGVQDFDPKVQRAIHREQSFELTRDVIQGLRGAGARRVNVDALYGLPHQTREGLERTIDQTAELAPDRVALFGYAHVPWMSRRQSMIPEQALPGPEERVVQYEAADKRLRGHGFMHVGIDHFAKPDDPMAVAAREGRLRRNVQGYTPDDADALIGLGASAVSRLPQGYAQNQASTANYQASVAKSGIATARGAALTPDDKLRAYVIERLMCDLAFDGDAVVDKFGVLAASVLTIAGVIPGRFPDAVSVVGPKSFRIAEAQRPLARCVAAEFDAYLESGAARYSNLV